MSDRFSPGFMAEVLRFERCSGTHELRTKLGLRQFSAYESTGIVPDGWEPGIALGAADSYFLRLWNGKRWWEWTLNEYAKLYGSADWWGWEQLRADFGHDIRGLRQVWHRVCQRFPGVPGLYSRLAIVVRGCND